MSCAVNENTFLVTEAHIANEICSHHRFTWKVKTLNGCGKFQTTDRSTYQNVPVLSCLVLVAKDSTSVNAGVYGLAQ